MPTMTATERRARAKVEYDAFLATCPTRQLYGTVANKWVGLVMCALDDGPKRHGELARAVAGVSQKMLTQTLRELERSGLITRSVTPSVPVRVDYEMTELGVSLQAVMQQLKDWAEANMDRILGAREHYDTHDRAGTSKRD
jgi:DNA-binding HxlR family transcriptional regulator